MGKLAAVLTAIVLCACACADQLHKRFDIAAQPATAALNEFARQADVTLIFSYDLVAGIHIQALKGRYTVDDGLTRLLDGTPLVYRRSSGGTYLICLSNACEPQTVAENFRSPVLMTSRWPGRQSQ